MPTTLRLLVVGIALLLTRSQEANAFLARDDLKVTARVIVNTTGGPALYGCEAVEPVVGASSKQRWAAIGEAKSDPEKGWVSNNGGIRCGTGPYAMRHPEPDSIPSSPYVVLEIMTVVIPQSQMEGETVLSLSVSISIRKLSHFDSAGKAVFSESSEKRVFFFAENAETFIPFMIADSRERLEFGFEEFLLAFQVGAVEKASAAQYGSLVVTSQTPGAEVFLDGGVAGRISGTGETILRNVPVGFREVTVRGASARGVSGSIRVIANRKVVARLNPEEPTPTPNHYRLTSLGKNIQGFEEYRRAMDGATVVRIPAGEFLMGNHETERTPLEHSVFVSEFLVDRLAVTWKQFKQFAGATGIPLPPQEPYWGTHDDHPAVYVSWEEAKAYCEWAGGRLPTEAEREKAARGTDGRKFPWGSEEPDPQHGVFRGTWGHEATGPVGVLPLGASPYGVQDMGGNVWEWCSDWYDGDYYAASPLLDPKGPPTGLAHVVRGGSWDSRPSVLSASCRNWGHRGYRDGDFGFRCAMSSPRASSTPAK